MLFFIIDIFIIFKYISFSCNEKNHLKNYVHFINCSFHSSFIHFGNKTGPMQFDFVRKCFDFSEFKKHEGKSDFLTESTACQPCSCRPLNAINVLQKCLLTQSICHASVEHRDQPLAVCSEMDNRVRPITCKHPPGETADAASSRSQVKRGKD